MGSGGGPVAGGMSRGLHQNNPHLDGEARHTLQHGGDDGGGCGGVALEHPTDRQSQLHTALRCPVLWVCSFVVTCGKI